MQVQKVSFTSSETPQKPKKESALYRKEGYMNLLRASQFTEGLLGGYAVLETIDKFQLIKNKRNLPAKTLKQIAWKHTKYNLLGGVATGVLSALIGKYFTDKYTIPLNEKISDWADKQNRINAKAKELIEAEDNLNKEKTESNKKSE